MEKSLDNRLRNEFDIHSLKSHECREDFRGSLAFGIGLPAFMTAFSYILQIPEQSNVTRMAASLIYMGVSPFMIIHGIRYYREKALASTLGKIIEEINYPGKTNLGNEGYY